MTTTTEATLSADIRALAGRMIGKDAIALPEPLFTEFAEKLHREDPTDAWQVCVELMTMAVVMRREAGARADAAVEQLARLAATLLVDDALDEPLEHALEELGSSFVGALAMGGEDAARLKKAIASASSNRPVVAGDHSVAALQRTVASVTSTSSGPKVSRARAAAERLGKKTRR